jgi:DNA-directed RNA polymerase subunit RPC12/RpoP
MLAKRKNSNQSSKIKKAGYQIGCQAIFESPHHIFDKRCDPCGIQIFIRGPAGIAAFYRLVDRAEQKDLLTRLEEMEHRYRLKCPKCGIRFWAERGQVKTNVFDGRFRGFACPGCESVIEWGKGWLVIAAAVILALLALNALQKDAKRPPEPGNADPQ